MKEIFWINGADTPHIAIVLRPRGEDWLEDELRRIRQGGIQTVVSLLEPHEAEWLGLRDEAETAARIGLDFLSFPIPDTHVPPDRAAFDEFVSRVVNRLAAGEYIGVHCRGCIGRATITAACALVHLGWEPQAALSAIAEARGMAVPDTPEQEAWILRYRPRE